MLKRFLVFLIVLMLVLVPTNAIAATTRTMNVPFQAKSANGTGLQVSLVGSYGSAIFCTNLGDAATTFFQLVFYYSDSSTIALSYNDTDPIPAGYTRSYFTPSSPAGVPSPFFGSAVVSSDQPIACNVNTQNTGTGVGSSTNPARDSTYEGVDSSQASTTLFAPQVEKVFYGWNSYIVVQNTETYPITVDISYKDRFATAYPLADESVSIPAQSNHIFYQENNANLPSMFLGGAKITSSGKMAAMVSFYNSGVDSSTSQFLSYTAFPSGSNKLFVPRFVRNFYGFQGGLTIQNIGETDTSATITFTYAGNSYSYNTGTIIPGATYAVYAPNVPVLVPVDSLPVSQRTGSAIIQADPGGLIVGVINEDNRGVCSSGVAVCGAIQANWVGLGATYEAVSDGAQTNTVWFLQVPRHVGSADYSGGYAFANTTNNATTCDITFPTVPAANQSGVELAAYGSISIFAPNIPNLTDGFNASVKVTCGQPILGISNFSARNPSHLGDSFGYAIGLSRQETSPQ